MSWLTQTISSTIGRKVLVSLTGLFLITFLVVHLIGNFQLFKTDGGYAFNAYAKFMTTNPLIKISSYILYAGILAHIIITISLTLFNKKARGSEAYKITRPSANSTWTSRNMGLLGTIILIFLVIHLQNFWYQMKFGTTPVAKYELATTGEITKESIEVAEVTSQMLKQEGVYKDLYLMVSEAFKEIWLVVIYVLAMIGLGLHLAHGFQSAFQTLGLNHSRYTPFIQKLGLAFSIVVPALFASMPLIFYFR